MGVVGCGTIAQLMHLPHLVELSHRFELLALCDRDEATLDAVAEQYAVPRRHVVLESLLAEPVDVVMVLTGGDHTEAVLAALDSERHVFCEKPLSYSVRGADEIAAAARRRGRLVMVGMMNRYDPGYVRGAAAAAALRDLRYVDARVLHPELALYQAHHRLRPDRRGPTAGEEPLLGARFDDMLAAAILEHEPRDALAELAGSRRSEDLLTAFLLASSIHDVNCLRAILGEPTEVIGGEAWDGGTSYTAILAFGERVRATYTWSFLPHLRAYEQHYSFLASVGRVHIRFPSPFLRNAPTLVEVESMRDGGLVRRELVTSYEEAFKLELVHLHECVASGAQPLTGVDDFRRDLEVLQAVARLAARV